ncbi:MAG TPA: hypothetical protein VHT05_08835 [Candidatus Elarobacter sp.]|nr:hypothetical protein [Candidatus Elarobacter sp.]
MSARIVTLAVAVVAIALVVAQDAYPATPLYHTWQYALALTIALVAIGAYASGARRGTDGVAGRRLILALGGAAIVTVAGLAAGLLGPDTAQLIGTPGTVTPIPALGAAAFFGAADAATIAGGGAGVVLRRRNAPDVVVAPGAHCVFGESLLYLTPRPAAYVDVYDERGAHLTVTQPANASFLSPVLLFPQHQRIGELDVPFDTFAAPARRRTLRALYFTQRDLAAFDHRGAVLDASRPGLILTAADDRDKQLGITLAPSQRDVEIAGLRVRATVGTYPALSIASAPPTWALVVGIALFLAGCGWSALRTGTG